MSHRRVVLLYSLIISLLRASHAQVGTNGTSGTCCYAPVSLFSTPEQLEDLGFVGIPSNFYLVQLGTVDAILTLPGLADELALPTRIVEFPLVWGSSLPNVTFNITIVSGDTDVLAHPLTLPVSSGIAPTEPFILHVLFPCLRGSPDVVQVTTTVTTTSNYTREAYCPITFKFGKLCAEENTFDNETLMEYMTKEFVNETIPDPLNCTASTPPGITSTILRDTLLGVLVPVVTLSAAVILIVILLWFAWYRSSKKRLEYLELIAVGTAYQSVHKAWEPKREPHKKEFPADRLRMKRELGEGAFGVVYEGEAEDIFGDNEVSSVAVKQLRDSSAMDEFFREVDFMSRLSHPKVVNLLGVCSVNEPYAMIFEYMDLGDLCSFLRDAALMKEEGQLDDEFLVLSEKLSIALQISEGMEYIASKQLVHRDLAARNCLVATGLIVKIGDFGMARNIYTTDYYKVTGSALLPVRWMAPESICHGKFSEASDIWSFGILFWEIFTLGQQPYAGSTNEEVVELVRSQGHLEIPPNCSVGHVMIDCWQWRPRLRPTFAELHRQLATLHHDTVITEGMPTTPM